MKNKKIIIIVISIILILAISVGIGITIYFNNKPKNKPEDVLQTFASYINDKKYQKRYYKHNKCNRCRRSIINIIKLLHYYIGYNLCMFLGTVS